MNNNFNIVNLLLGFSPTIENLVYILVGVSAAMAILGCKCKKCREACASCSVGDKTEEKI